MKRRHLVASLALAAFAAACSSSGPTSSTNGNNNGNNTATGTMTATIDGASWTANFQTRASLTNGTLSITGESYTGTSSQTRVVTIAVTNAVADSTYTLYAGGDGHGGNAITTLGGTSQWFSASAGGSGSITVATLNATHVTGTFAFVGIGAGSIGNSTVTSGVFDIPF